MIDARLAPIVDRVTQERAARAAERDEQLAAAERAARARAAELRPGDRVFDTVSGLFGVVVERSTRNIIVPNP
jgi:hypothetical protein